VLVVELKAADAGKQAGQVRVELARVGGRLSTKHRQQSAVRDEVEPWK